MPGADQNDFFSAYLAYTSNTEVPTFYSRWCAIASIGALLGRQYYIPHSHSIIYPNIYCMLIGSSGTKKSTAIKLAKKLLRSAGYTTIAASKTTKEKFMLDLAGENDDSTSQDPDAFMDAAIFGNASERDAEMFIMADEFNDFFGNGNIEFISLLGNLWDYEGVFDNRIKNGNSVSITNPTISILGGNTPTNFSLAFPAETLGQGFFSRLLLVYGEPNGRRIAFPRTPETGHTESIINSLRSIKQSVFGQARLSGDATKLLERIYQSNARVDDVRFDAYSNRRFQHLIKLCLIVSAARLSTGIEEHDVVYANTILTYTESFMPKALGEFGRARNADVSHTVLDIISRSNVPMGHKALWKEVRQHLENMSKLAEILQALAEADKIQYVPTHRGFLPKRRVVDQKDSEFVKYSLLTPEERGMSL